MSEIVKIGLEGVMNGMSLALRDSQRVINGSSTGDFESVVAASVDLKLDEHQVRASAKVIKVGAQLMDDALDIIA